MSDFTFCPAWPQELKDAERERQRQHYLIKSLEAKLERVEPEGMEYWDTVARIEATQDALQAAATLCMKLKYLYERRK